VGRRGIVFAAVTAACTLLAGGYLAWAALRAEPATSDAAVLPVREQAPAPPPGPPGPVAAAPGGRLMVRAVDPQDPRLNGVVTTVGVGTGAAPEPSGSLACQRVYQAGGRGLCLTLAGTGVEYEAHIFDGRMETVHELPLEGIPSRARVSPDGRYGTYTSFVTGDSYTAAGQFSTRTVLVDMHSGERIADLESFRVERDGETIDSPDFNFWGVTFARDSNRFYATLSTGGHHYLVEGDVAARRVRVLLDGVECPSLSPDETRIAYKGRIAGSQWRLHVLELDGMRRILLGESRSVDDQPEWLEGGWVAYGLDGDVWAVRGDGRGRPRKLLAQAASPTALR
jgi:hypothetical protein